MTASTWLKHVIKKIKVHVISVVLVLRKLEYTTKKIRGKDHYSIRSYTHGQDVMMQKLDTHYIRHY